MNIKHIFHCLKLLALYQNYLMALKCTQLEHVDSTKAGASEHSHKALQKLLTPSLDPSLGLTASPGLSHPLKLG